MSKKQLLAIIVTGLLLGVGIAVAAQQLFTLSTSGTIEGQDLSFTPSTIDWGTVAIGTAYTETVTITNIGTKPFASLTMTYGNPSTNLGTYTVTWDKEDSSLAVGASVLATFTLTITSATTPPYDFTFDIYIQE